MADLREYHPWLRDRIAAMIQGDDKSYSMRGKLAKALVGSNGVSPSLGLADFTPAGIPLNAYDMGRHGAQGEPTNAFLSGLNLIPGSLMARIPGLVKKGAQTLTGAEDAAKIPASIAQPVPHVELPEDGFVYPGGQFMTRNEAAAAVEKAHPQLKGELVSEFDDMSADTISHLAGGRSMDEDIPHGGITKGTPEAKLVVARRYPNGQVISGKTGDIHADLPMEPPAPSVQLNNPTNPLLAKSAADVMSRRGFLGGVGAVGAAVALPKIAGKAVEAAAPAVDPIASALAPGLKVHINAFKAHHAAMLAQEKLAALAGEGADGEIADGYEEAVDAASKKSNTAFKRTQKINNKGLSPEHENYDDIDYNDDWGMYEQSHTDLAEGHASRADEHIRALQALGMNKQDLLDMLPAEDLADAESQTNIIDGAYHN